MIKKALVLIAAPLCLLAAASAMKAWDDEGHMAVAEIAYQNLKPEVKQRAIALVKLNPSYQKWVNGLPQKARKSQALVDEMTFMLAATWPDEIKARDSGYQDDGDSPSSPTASANAGYDQVKVMHKYWHYVDRPYAIDGLPHGDAPSPNAETQMAVFRQVIASDQPDALKSYDLVWLMHVVGDVHQPLHCVTRFTQTEPGGDRGGNDVKLTTPPGELHGFWDNVLGTSKAPSKAKTLAKALAPADTKLAGDTSADDWITESFGEAKTDVYVQPIGPGTGPYSLTKKYKKHAQALAKQRVALAGARLANVLNAELK
jgi:hypothetical protein